MSITVSELGDRALKSTLTVYSPFLEEPGSYTCVAENVVDTASSTVDVLVFCEFVLVKGSTMDTTYPANLHFHLHLVIHILLHLDHSPTLSSNCSLMAYTIHLILLFQHIFAYSHPHA